MTDQANKDPQNSSEPLDQAALNEEASRELAAMVAEAESSDSDDSDSEAEVPVYVPKSDAERAAIIETLVFVSDEPLSAKVIADVLKGDRDVVEGALAKLAEEFNA